MLKPIKNWWGHNAYTIAILFTIVIIVLSLASFSSVGVNIIKVKNSDKLAHVLAYFFLSLSWLFATRKRYATFRQKLILVACLILFGIILEALQDGLTTYREADFNDVLANAVGVIIATISFNQVRSWLNSMLK